MRLIQRIIFLVIVLGASPAWAADVTFTNETANITVTTNTIEKTGATDLTWDASATSRQIIPASTDGSVEFQFVAAEHAMCALSQGDTDSNFTSLDFAIYANASNDIYVYEEGTDRGLKVTGFATSDWFKVERSGTTITYYRDTGGGYSSIYTSGISSSSALIFDASISGINGKCVDVRITGAVGFPATDESGLDDYDATTSGTIGTVAGEYGNAALFVLTTPGEFSIIDNADVSLVTSTATWEAIFEPVEVINLNSRPVITKRATSGGAGGYMVRQLSNDVECWVYTGTTWYEAQADNVLTAGTTYHAGCVYDGANLRIWVTESGNSVSSEANATTAVTGNIVDSSDAFQVGSDLNEGTTYNGWIDEVRVSSVARAYTDFCNATACIVDSDTVVMYHMDTDARPTWGATAGSASVAVDGADAVTVTFETGTRAGNTITRVYASTTTPVDRRAALIRDFGATATTGQVTGLSASTLYYFLSDVIDAAGQDGLTNTTEKSATTNADTTAPEWNADYGRPKTEIAPRTYTTWDAKFLEADDVGTTNGFEEYDLVVWSSLPSAWATPAPTWTSSPAANDEATVCNDDELKRCSLRFTGLATGASEYWAAVKVTDSGSNVIAFDVDHVVHVTNPVRGYLSVGNSPAPADNATNLFVPATSDRTIAWRDSPLSVASAPEQCSLYWGNGHGGTGGSPQQIRFILYRTSGANTLAVGYTSLFTVSGASSGRQDFDVSSAWTWVSARSPASGDFLGVAMPQAAAGDGNVGIAGQTTGGDTIFIAADQITDIATASWTTFAHTAYAGCYDGDATWLADYDVLWSNFGDAEDGHMDQDFDATTGTLVGTDRWVETLGTITGNTVANPTVVNVATHDLLTAASIVISGSDSTPTIDGTRTISSPTTNTFTVPVNVTVAGTTGTVSGRLAALDEKVIQFINATADKNFTPPSEAYSVYFNAWNFDDADGDTAKVALRTSGGVDVASMVWSNGTLTVDTDAASSANTTYTLNKGYRYLMRVDPSAGTVRFMIQVEDQPIGADQAVWEAVIAELAYTGTIAELHFSGDTDDGLEVNDIVIAKNVWIAMGNSITSGVPWWAKGPANQYRTSLHATHAASNVNRVNNYPLMFGTSITKQLHIENVGVGDGTGVGMVNRWTADVINHGPDGVILAIGTNDLWHTAPEDLLSVAKARTCNGFWRTLWNYPFGNLRRMEIWPSSSLWVTTPADSEGLTPRQRVDSYNTWIADQPTGWDYGLIPTWDETEDPGTPYAILAAYQADATHPNVEGFRASVAGFALPNIPPGPEPRCVPEMDARRLKVLSND